MNSGLFQFRLTLILIAVITYVTVSKNIEGYMEIDGLERFYIVHVPDDVSSGGSRLPLVLVLHGGGGNAKQMMKFSKFNNTADDGGFIAVYPEGYNKNWSDGRIGDELPILRDDVKFISMLIDTLIVKYNVDSSRIFSTGISNGGFFSIYLAYKLSNRILAIAPLCANIPENLKDNFSLPLPVSMMLINGTEDKLVKYNGGSVGFREGNRGNSISTDETIRMWVGFNGCSTIPSEEVIPNKNKKDDCKAAKYTYSSGKNNTEVILIKITGGGHTWPGRTQYLPKIIVGNVCKDFDANDYIWEFFKRQSIRLQ
ncbi:MAG TPA: PHB depolymerase family esterase [Ignavibacteria bacterium]|nr:PHB depolymerase family esterase [Ignavibacteria bacterium]